MSSKNSFFDLVDYMRQMLCWVLSLIIFFTLFHLINFIHVSDMAAPGHISAYDISYFGC
jgi:hypothetical protein